MDENYDPVEAEAAHWRSMRDSAATMILAGFGYSAAGTAVELADEAAARADALIARLAGGPR